MSRPRLFGIVGPTAAGKTAAAAIVACEIGAEIVSVDSRQVYRRLDVGTAKPGPDLRALVPHHMIDVADPAGRYDAARFASDARRAIEGILARGRRVLLCGGSGLYLRALTEGLCPAPPADDDARAALRARLAEVGAEALHAELRDADPESARRIAPRDAQRILRALEVLQGTGRPLSAWQAEHRFADRPWEVRLAVLAPAVEDLDRRIAERTRAMWQQGLVEETASALAAGVPPDAPGLQSIGYREAQLQLAGVIGREDAIAAASLATRRYAKRQRTWFRSLLEARVVADADPVPALRRLAVESFAEGADAAHLS